jgi:hypothetical protein
MGDGIAADPIGFGTPPMLPWFYPRCAGRCPMSTMMKIRSRFPSSLKVGTPDPIRTTGQGRFAPNLKPIPSEEEPQEDSVRVTEAPESWQDSHAEAPDAGRGVSHSIVESEFTHGRSRS